MHVDRYLTVIVVSSIKSRFDTTNTLANFKRIKSHEDYQERDTSTLRSQTTAVESSRHSMQSEHQTHIVMMSIHQ